MINNFEQQFLTRSERMSIDLAGLIEKQGGDVTLDEALPVMATPLAVIDYKEADARKVYLRPLMMEIRRFVKNNKRFLTYTKEAIRQELIDEWLPTLDEDDKYKLVSDIRLIEDIDDRGHIVANAKFYELYLRQYHNKKDDWAYGALTYGAKAKASVGKTAKRRPILTSAVPDTQLAGKMAKYVEWYKENWDFCQGEECYKWEAMKHFIKHIDLNATDLRANLKEAFAKEINLLSNRFYTPLDMLLKNSSFAPEEVRNLLYRLFDESQPLTDRIEKFLADFKELNQRHVDAGLLRTNESHQQSERSISVYLAFMYPTKYFLYKKGMWDNFKSELGLDYPPLSHYGNNLTGYTLIAPQIREILLADDELVALWKRDQADDPSQGNLLTQDFMYCIAKYYNA